MIVNKGSPNAADRHNAPYIECSVFSCSVLYDPNKAISALKKHTAFEICFVAEGSGIHCILNQDIPCKKGDICIISPNVPHEYFLSDSANALTVRKISFNIDDWFFGDVVDKTKPKYAYGVFSRNRIIAYATLNSYMQEKIYPLFDYIEAEATERDNGWQELIRGYLTNLLVSIGRYINSAIKNVNFTSDVEWEAVSRALELIKAEYKSSSLTLEYIAGKLYISKSQLSRFFKKVMGVNFSDYLQKVRINRVSELLLNTDENICTVAASCGFHSMAAFYKLFNSEMGMTPNEYRNSNVSKNDIDEYKKLLMGEKIMSIMAEISENLQKGKAKIVKELVQQAIDEGVKPADILEQGLLHGMGIVGEKFKNNEVYVPEVLVAARAMNMGTQILKPYLNAEGIVAGGKVCIGTVQGDLHDIGKNLVKMMMEGKGLEVVDLGTDVSPEAFVQAAIDNECDVICCSALLTTTMPVMKDVVEAAKTAGIREKVKIMVGGAPVSQEYCDSIGADCYTVDAASAADAAVAFCKK